MVAVGSSGRSRTNEVNRISSTDSRMLASESRKMMEMAREQKHQLLESQEMDALSVARNDTLSRVNVQIIKTRLIELRYN